MIVAAENTSVKLPPSQRDFEVYELVAVQCNSTRAAAAQFGISQTRVRQVLARVAEHIAQAAPEEAEELSKGQRLIAGERLAGMRLDFLYGELVQSWRVSQQETGLGKPMYLGQAMRIAVAAAKLPLRPMPQLAEEHQPAEEHREANAASAAPLEPENGARHVPATTSPLVRDCSEEVPSRGGLAHNAAQPFVLSISPDEPCKTLDEIQLALRSEFARPAQSNGEQRGESVSRGEEDLRQLSPALGRGERPDPIDHD